MKIEITKILQQTVEVGDCEIDEAITTVRNQYQNGEISFDEKKFKVEFDVFPSVRMGRISHDDDIREIIEYLWKEEERHWLESECPPDHIFHVLRRLKAKYG